MVTSESISDSPGRTEDSAESREDSPPKAIRRWYKIPFAAAVGAWIVMLLSLTPSLLPRPGIVQGLVTGVAIAIGYGLGVLVGWFVRQFTERYPSDRSMRILWKALSIIVLVTGLLMLLRSFQLQSDLFELMETAAPNWLWFPLTIVVSALFAFIFIGLARLIRRGARSLGRLFGRWMPARTGRALGIILAGVITIVTVNGVLLSGALSVTEELFKSSNGNTSEGTVNPDTEFTSGGPDSAMTWESLGRKGRDFIGGVTKPTELADFSAKPPAAEPIRVYAGIETGDANTRAELAVADLLAMGAFDRELLAVGTTTGTGWVDEQAVDPLEYMFNGDTAIVATQYSYLPSWLSFLVDKDKAKEAGITLFDAVYAVWNELPADQRPTLVVFGESLGSFGAEAAFSGLSDIQNRTDAALFIGPPNSNDLWKRYVDNRDPGSLEILPVFQDGEDLRFAGIPSDVDNPPTPWNKPRALYLQHASDPIVWWSPDLLFTEPDWLMEERGRDVLPELSWIPILTFLQISADMMTSTGYPAGHGHWYGENQTNAWASLIAPEGWTQAETDKLHELMALNEK